MKTECGSTCCNEPECPCVKKCEDERYCEKHFDEVFPDWFEDFVVNEWDYKASKDVYAQNEWNKE